MSGATELRDTVRAKYGEAAQRVMAGGAASCCGTASTCCGAAPGNGTKDPITSDLYSSSEAALLP